jgi:hypothetical protein
MESKDKNSIKKQLEKLPIHEPKSSVWDKISADLDNSQPDFKSMPEFEPKENVWEVLNQKLDVKERFRFQISAAAVLLIIGISSFFIFKSFNTSNLSYSSDKEIFTMPENLDSEQNFERILAFCQTKVEQCEEQDFEVLKSEFEVLKKAETQLRDVMGDFNTSPELLEQLESIETQKRELIEQMTNLI